MSGYNVYYAGAICGGSWRKGMRHSRLLIFAGYILLLCTLCSCIGRDEAEASAGVHESAAFVSQGQTQAQPEVQQIQAPSGHQIALRTEHVRYMSGENNMFRPNDPLTRGQLAQILCSLIQEGVSVPDGGVAFSDVEAGGDVYDSVEQLAYLGIMGGYGDGTFRPEQPVTRAEMVAALCRMMNVSEVAGIAFPDVDAEYWAMGSVAAAMAKGWLSGFEDGSFYPDAPLTRAEAAVLLNRARGQSPNKAAIDLACETSPYQDVGKDFWAYYDIVDVSFTNEMMAYILGEADGLSQGMILLDENMAHVNAERKLDFFQKGFHTIQDGLATDGLYYAPEDGYFLRRSQPGLQELDGSMFYVERADGPFAVNFDLGYLHFGDNGRYTSGDAAVDGYVDSIMAGIIQGSTGNLLNEDKLRQAYDYILFGNFDYMSLPTGWQRGTTSWSLECARYMYENRAGSCYYWAASFLYLARRLGFQAYPVCGGVNENNALHAWVMIDHGDIDSNDVNTEESKNELTRKIDPDEYIYDIELDWAYRTGAHGRVPVRPGRNLFKQTRGQTIVDYIFPGDTWEAPPMDDTDALGDEDDGDGDGTGSDDLFTNNNGDQMVEGVDYTTAYVNNGDGTITVTITYLTGDRAGTSTSYTIPDENWNPNTTPSNPPATEPPATNPPVTNPPVTEPPVTEVPVTDPPVTEQPVTDPPVTEPTADPNAGVVTDPNAGTVTDPNAGAATDPNAGAATDPNAGAAADPNAGAAADPNAGAAADPNVGAASNQPAEQNPAADVDPGAVASDSAFGAAEQSAPAGGSAETGVAA